MQRPGAQRQSTLARDARALTGLIAFGLIALGVWFTLRNEGLPILRNSLVYAHAVESIEQHHFALWQVCSDRAQVHAQGCGFPVFALPFTRLTGLNAGLKIASCAGTIFLVFALIVFFRRFNEAVGLSDRDVPLELAVAFFNPLMMAQFWSAHSDTVSAALMLVSFVLLDRLLKDEELRESQTAIAYTGAVMLAVFARPAALVLYPLQLVYVLWNRKRLAAIRRDRPRRFKLLAASAAVLGAWVASGKLGLNPLLNINQGEYQYPIAYLASVNSVLVLIGITFGVLAIVTLPKLRVDARSAPLLAMLVGYMHVFMVFHASVFNLRYYIPAIPFMTLFLVQALRSLQMERKRMAALALAAFALVNAGTIVVFNDAAANRLFTRVAPQRIDWGEFGHFDNLRMAMHLRMKDSLDRINAELPPGATLDYVTTYYGGVADGIYQREGLLRPDLRIRYAMRLEDLGEIANDAWVFLPERLSRHPADPPGKSYVWLMHGAMRLSSVDR